MYTQKIFVYSFFTTSDCILVCFKPYTITEDSLCTRTVCTVYSCAPVWLFDLVAPSVVAAPVSVPTAESSTSADKPVKSKAELKAERRARQEADRAAKHAKKEPGATSTNKPKAPQSDLQLGNIITVKMS